MPGMEKDVETDRQTHTDRQTDTDKDGSLCIKKVFNMEQMDKDGKWIVSPSTEDQKFNSWKSGRRMEERLPVFRLVLVFLK